MLLTQRLSKAIWRQFFHPKDVRHLRLVQVGWAVKVLLRSRKNWSNALWYLDKIRIQYILFNQQQLGEIAQKIAATVSMDNLHGKELAIPGFCGGQEILIDSVFMLPSGDIFGITTGPESLCVIRCRLALPGITLIVSPLISLMKDQVGDKAGRRCRLSQQLSNVQADSFGFGYAQGKI